MQKSMVRPQDEDFGRDHGLIHEAVVTGRKVGAGHEFWTKLAHDEELFGKVVALVDRNGYEAITSQKRAREIMGKNIFGIEEAIRHFGVNPSKQQIAFLAEVPFTEEVLESHKDTHVLVAVFPMSILDVRKVDNALFYSSTGGWYQNEKFAKSNGTVGWHFVRKTPVENSTLNNWNEQQALLGKDEETPTARVMVYTIIGHYKNTGERLFGNICVRCYCVDSDGYRVSVIFCSFGLIISGAWDDDRWYDIGLSAARKFRILNS